MAIAFDAASSVNSATDVTSLTVSHTCTGSDLTLTAIVTIGGNAATCTGVTYNGVAMTQGVVSGPDGDNNRTYIFYLANPATGAHNLVASFSANASPVSLGGISLTGTNTSSPIGASATPSGTSGNFSNSITTSFVNSIVVDGFVQGAQTAGDAPAATGTNHTSKYTFSAGLAGNVGGGITTTTAAGSRSLGWNVPSSHTYTQAMLEIRELAATSLTIFRVVQVKQAVNKASTY
jgi:hypothetical protein